MAKNRKDNKAPLPKSEYINEKQKAAQDAEKQARRKAVKEAKKQNKQSFKQRVRSTGFKHGSMNAVVVAAALAILVLVNVLFSVLGDRFPSMNLDLTAQNLNSLSEDAKKAVQAAKQDTDVIIMGTEQQIKGDQSYSQVANLCGKMRELNGKIKVSYKDVDKDPTFAAKFGDEKPATGDVVVQTAKRHQIVGQSDMFSQQQDSQTGETQSLVMAGDAIASAVTNVNAESLPLVAFDTGHGNLLSGDSASSFKKLLTGSNFEVKEFDMVKEEIPAKAQLLILGDPSADYTDADVKKMDAFLAQQDGLDRGLLVTADVQETVQPKLNAFLKEWGMTLQDKGVVDETNCVGQQPTMLLAEPNTDAKLNEKASYDKLLTPMVRPITVAENVSGLTVTPLLHSGSTSYSLATTQKNAQDAQKSAQQSFPLAAMGEKTVGKDDKESNASVALVGSSHMFANSYVDANVYSNGAWTADLAKYMTGTTGTETAVIIPKQVNTVDIQGVTGYSNGLLGLGVFTFLVPVACFVAGVIVYVRRRKL